MVLNALKRMKFESEDRIRFINDDGIDCLLAFRKKDVPDGIIKVVSFCKRDNWNPDFKKANHYIMERRWQDNDNDMLERLSHRFGE